ncbi:MAG: cyclic nucleotide-binding domain-containing protein [Gammaproteobacteria bacterium]
MDRLAFLEEQKLLQSLHIPSVTLLEISNWVEELPPAVVDELAFYFRPCTVAPGTMIIQEGDNADFFCLLCEGIVDVIKETASGELKLLQTLGIGKAFGEIAFFDQGSCSANVIVKEKATLLIMDQHKFDLLCKEKPYAGLVLTLKLIRMLTQRLRQTSNKLADLL